MKSIKLNISILLILCLTIACDQDLTEELKGSLSASTLTSEADARSLVDGVYNQLLAGGWNYHASGELIRATDGITDVLIAGRTSDLEQFRWSEDQVAPIWQAAYVLINRANTAIDLIENMDDANFSNPKAKAALIAEAKFLRSLSYFDLTGAFGGVPLRLEPTSDPNSLMPRSELNEVYTQLITDLEEAASNLPASQDGIGKATSGAAYTLLSKIYFRQKDWTNAKKYIDMVIGLNVYDLYTEGSVNELFLESKRLDNEFIFVAMSLGSEYNKSNHHLKFFTPWGYDLGWGGDFGVPADVFNLLEPVDERNAIIVNDLSGAYYGYVQGYGTSLAWKGFAMLSKYSGFNRDVTSPGNLWGNYGSSALNQPIFRYADILLMKAEVENELNGGPNTAAYSAINEVRNRASASDLPSGLNQDAFRTAVLEERALELVGEGHRKDDLIRHGIFESTMTQYLIDQGYPSPVTVTEDYRVFPIPRLELDLNPEMVKNPLNN